MRANGVPKFPDPQPTGGFVFSAGSGVDPSSPAFQTAQAKCQKLMGGPLAPTHTHPSPQALTKLDRIARCMRQHGIADFPDPRTTVPSDPGAASAGVITNYDGVILLFPSNMNLQAPAYRQALSACGAPPLGLRH
jgi:hypothetical protein